MKKLLLSTLLLLSLGACRSSPQITTREIIYSEGDQKLVGHLALDARKSGKRPGILIVHQWMGLSDHERERAAMLAEEGYVVLAADVYGPDNRPEDVKQAAQAAGHFRTDRELYRRRLLAGLEQLKQHPAVDPQNLGAIGFCFGGTGVLELVRTGAPVQAVVSFHGGLDGLNEEEGEKIKARVLICHGAADPLVPAEGIAAMTRQFNRGKVDWQMISYGGAVHGFTQEAAGNDPSRGVAYDALADRRSWEAMMALFTETFMPPRPSDLAAEARERADNDRRVRQMMRSHRPVP